MLQDDNNYLNLIPRFGRLSLPEESIMSRRLLREGNEGESSLNGVHILSANTSQIVQGGCYGPPSPPSWSPNFKSPPNLQPASRRWIAVALLLLAVIIGFAVWRFSARK